MTDRHCALLQPRTRGLATASSTTAASPRRSRVAPTAPATGNRCVASAAPNWNDVHDPSTSSTAVSGRPVAPALWRGVAAAGGAEVVVMPLQSPMTDWFVQRWFSVNNDKQN